MRMRPFLPVLALALILFISAAHAGLKWPVFHTGAPVVGAPVVGGNVVYALTDDGIIYSLDYVTGGQSLPFNLGGPASVEPVSDGQNLYVGTDDGQVQAIDMARTQRLWRYPAQPTNRTLAPLAGLAIGPGLVYVVTKNQTIALNASTGAVRWARPLSNGGGPAGADALRVYVADGQNLLAFSKDGVPLWTLPAGPLFKTHPVSDPSSGRLYLATTSGQVLSIEASSGTILWSYPLNGWAMSSPAPAPGGLVIVGSNDGRVRALSAGNGEMVWATPVGGAVWSQPAIATSNGVSIAIVGTQDNSLVALNVSNGALLWRYPTTDWTGSPAIGPDGRTVLAGSRDGSIWALLISPICTIDSPRTGQLVGPLMVIHARAWAWNGARRATIRAGPLGLPTVSLNGSGPFDLSVDLSTAPAGDLPISCLAEDSAGLAETDAAGAKAIPVESPNAPQENLTLTLQSPVEPGTAFKLWMRNVNGQDLSGVSLDFNGANQTVDSPVTLSAPLREGTYALTASRDGYAPATATLTVRGSSSGLLIGILIAIVALAAVFYWFFVRKKSVAAPTDYSQL